MRIEIDRDGLAENLHGMLESLVRDPDVAGLLVLACSENGFEPQVIDPILKECPVPVVGGIFPALNSGTEILSRGTLVLGLPVEPTLMIIPGMSDPATDFDAIIADLAGAAPVPETLLVLLDGFSSRIGSFIDALYMNFGLEINYVGGGAGSLGPGQSQCLFTNRGMIGDAALLAGLPLHSGVGVSHGWSSISAPFKVTESVRNRILSLDWKSAGKVYGEVLEAHCGCRVTRDNFFDIARAYPFGIAKLGAEVVVRDPILLNSDESLTCVGEVPEGAFVDILHGERESLIQAARNASLLSRHDFGEDSAGAVCISMDCISRKLFLGDAFEAELEAMAVPGVPWIGACSIGEIANNRKDYLEFYNKTSVVMLLEMP